MLLEKYELDMYKLDKELIFAIMSTDGVIICMFFYSNWDKYVYTNLGWKGTLAWNYKH